MALYPNLTYAKTQIEKILFGGGAFEVPTTVRITRDPNGPSDDTFNTTTGEWTRVGLVTIYAGPASIKSAGEGFSPPTIDVGGGPEIRTTSQLRIPLSSPELHLGDFVEILTFLRDPTQVGRRYRVDRTTVSSLMMVRKAVIREFTPFHQELP